MTSENGRDTSAASKPRKRWLRRFVKDRDGVTVIEFALLALPFSLLIFAILESCISFGGQEYMQNTADDFARELRTGRIRRGDLTAEQFRTRVCNRLEAFVAKGCPGLSIDVRTFNTFAEAAVLRTKFKNGDIDTTGFKFDPGLSSTKNMMRMYYRWPVMTDILRKQMSQLNGNTTLHFATVTWQNEPFPDVVAGN